MSELGEDAHGCGSGRTQHPVGLGPLLAAAPRQHPGEIRTPSGRKDCLLCTAVASTERGREKGGTVEALGVREG